MLATLKLMARYSLRLNPWLVMERTLDLPMLACSSISVFWVPFPNKSSTFQSGLSRRTKDKEKERDAAEVELSKLNLSRLDERERHLVFIQLAQISYLGVWASLLVNLSCCSVKNLSKCHVGSTQSSM